MNPKYKLKDRRKGHRSRDSRDYYFLPAIVRKLAKAPTAADGLPKPELETAFLLELYRSEYESVVLKAAYDLDAAHDAAIDEDFERVPSVESIINMCAQDVEERRLWTRAELGGELNHDLPMTGDEEYQFSLPVGMHITDRP